MHPNAEIGFRFMQAEQMFASIVELMPRSGGGAGGMTLQEKAKQALDDTLGVLPDQFVMLDILERVEERT
jgi:dynein heavy chain